MFVEFILFTFVLDETMRLKEKLSVNENKLQKANVEIEFHRMVRNIKP